MIVLIEPQCTGWQHESVNAGFIENLKKAVGKEEIKVYAERSHINCLKDLLPNIEKEIFFSVIDIPSKNLDYSTTFFTYKNLFYKILRDLKNCDIRAVFLLSCNKGNLLAIRGIASRFRNINFCIVVHGIMEQILNKEKVPPKTILSLETILKFFVNIKNVVFITYSPTAKNILANNLSHAIINRFQFLHLPFPTFIENNQMLNGDGKIHIAILGAGAKKGIHDFIQSIDCEIKDKISFDVLLRGKVDFSDVESVNIIKEGENITYFEIVQMIGRSNYTFIPHMSKEYQVSSSGILMDSIQQATPILSFDTNSTLWYNQYNIGRVCASYDEMKSFLIKLCECGDDLWDVYKQNIIKLRRKVVFENENIIKKILLNK